MKTVFTTAIPAAVLLMASAALAAPPPDVKCEASKNKSAGAYYACREKAAATAITNGLTPDYSRCTSKFIEKWNAAEEDGATLCPDNIALTAQIEDFIADQAAAAAAVIAGAAMASCGDGAINAASEHCDGSALDGYSCASFGFHGTLACTAGCDFDLSGCTTCPAPSVEYGRACWVLGAVAGNCTTACSTLGLVYDEATSYIGGSDGSDPNCVALLDLLGAPGGELDNPSGNCTTGLGCGVIPQFGYRARCATPVTDASSIFMDVRRACACQ